MNVRLRFVLLVLVLAVPAGGDELEVRAGFDGTQWLAPRDAIALHLNRSIAAEEGRLAVVIGDVDVTSMFEPASGGLSWRRDGLPLPSGESEVVVSRVDASGQWIELGRFPIKVLTRRGFQKASARPSFDLTNKGQLDRHEVPEASFSTRDQFQDFTGQGSLATEHQRGATILRTQTNITGVSYVNEALRFGEKGERAPLVDLSNYKFEVERGSLLVTAGHVSFGSHRHLINGFGSRGLVVTLGAGRPVSFSLGAMNGSSIVGWDNFSGVQNRDHRMFSATLGFELMPSRPGAMRLETSLLEGSLQPLSGFNQNAIQSAERSRGASLRLMASSPARRFVIDGAITRSRYRAARDEQLEAGLDVTPLREEDRDAAYVDVSLALLQNARFIGAQRTNLSLSATYERIEPLFRSVAAYVQPDAQRAGISLNGNAGPLVMQLAHARSEDNLDGIRSLLKTKTRELNASVGLALGPLFGTRRGARWVPALSASAMRVHQFGAYIPEDGGFSASHVPDQVSIGGQAAIEWQLQRVRFGYRSSVSRQDNRQPGRENADLRGDAGTVFFGFSPSDRFDVSLESSLEHQRNLEMDQRDRMRRSGVTLSWRLWRDIAVSGNYSRVYGRDALWTNERSSYDGYFDLSSGFSLWRTSAQQSRSRIFLRYSTREASTFDRIFDARSANEGWSINSGVSMSVF